MKRKIIFLLISINCILLTACSQGPSIETEMEQPPIFDEIESTQEQSTDPVECTLLLNNKPLTFEMPGNWNVYTNDFFVSVNPQDDINVMYQDSFIKTDDKKSLENEIKNLRTTFKDESTDLLESNNITNLTIKDAYFAVFAGNGYTKICVFQPVTVNDQLIETFMRTDITLYNKILTIDDNFDEIIEILNTYLLIF